MANVEEGRGKEAKMTNVKRGDVEVGRKKEEQGRGLKRIEGKMGKKKRGKKEKEMRGNVR